MARGRERREAAGVPQRTRRDRGEFGGNRGRRERRPMTRAEARAQLTTFLAVIAILTIGSMAGVNYTRGRMNAQAMDINRSAEETASVRISGFVTPNAVDCPHTYGYHFPGEVMRWCGLVEEWDKHFGLDTEENDANFLATIFEESGGNPNARSVDEAIGGAQVVSSDNWSAGEGGYYFNNCGTPRDVWKKSLDCRKDPAWLYVPNNNIHYSAFMRRTLLEQTGWNQHDALVRYGPNPEVYGDRYAQAVLTMARTCKISDTACQYITVLPIKK